MTEQAQKIIDKLEDFRKTLATIRSETKEKHDAGLGSDTLARFVIKVTHYISDEISHEEAEKFSKIRGGGMMGKPMSFFNNKAEKLDTHLHSLIDAIGDDPEFWLQALPAKQVPESAEAVSNDIDILKQLFEKFQIVTRQLRQRHSDRPTLDVQDEYDVQDLLHSLLKIYFDDIRTEEWTPSYAGASARMDFLLKDEKIVIETKMTRASLKDKGIGTELIEDITKYSKSPDCKNLICFVYDPDGYISNPAGLEKDLSRNEGGIEVEVVIRPR